MDLNKKIIDPAVADGIIPREIIKEKTLKVFLEHVHSNRLKSEHFWEEENKKYSLYEAILFSPVIDQLKKENPVLFVTEITVLFQFFCMRGAPKIINRFIELGLNKQIRWFISITDIMEKLDLINKTEEVKICYDSTICLIKTHLTLKFSNDLQFSMKLEGKKRKKESVYNLMHNEIYDLFKRRVYAIKKGKNSISRLDEKFQTEFDSLAKSYGGEHKIGI